MNDLEIHEYIPKNKLKHFKDYEDYLNYVRSMFDLDSEDHKRLFNVLVKLQSVGKDPVETLHHCKHQLGDDDCLDMLKLMIRINEMALDELKVLA